MRHEVSISIQAPPERVWDVIMDVERWPEWTASMSKVERLDPGELKPGSRVRITQPKLPKVVWKVSTVEAPRNMEWVYKSPVGTTIAGHRVEPEGAGSKATLTVDQRGLIAPLQQFLWGKLTREYMNMEANGLKSRSEAS